MYVTSQSDWSTSFKKLVIDTKQYFYLGVNANTDPIYAGKVHGGLFKLNETFGYVDGFFLGSPEHNQLKGFDLDFYGNYYLGWELWFQNLNTSNWVWGTPNNRLEWGGWGGNDYNALWGKVAPVS
jgi:hypothetical protein